MKWSVGSVAAAGRPSTVSAGPSELARELRLGDEIAETALGRCSVHLLGV